MPDDDPDASETKSLTFTAWSGFDTDGRSWRVRVPFGWTFVPSERTAYARGHFRFGRSEFRRTDHDTEGV